MVDSSTLRPPLKWAGSKSQLLPKINNYIPKDYSLYCEPFLGGGSLFFNLAPSNAIISDINEELINFYCILKNNLDELLLELSTYKYLESFYYKLRHLDRTTDYKQLSPIKRAARIYYLNKTCFNGLYRVNKNGQFNVPYNKQLRIKDGTPFVIPEENLRNISHYLNTNENLNNNGIIIDNQDFSIILGQLPPNSFVYLDPPYYPLSPSSSFTQYTAQGFSSDDHKRLKTQCDILTKNNIKFLLSNSDTDYIKNLYQGYQIISIPAKRIINSNVKGRGYINELLIKNY